MFRCAVRKEDWRACTSVSGHIERKEHPPVPAAAEPSAPSLKISGLIGCKDSLSGMLFGGDNVDSQLPDQQAVRHVVGDDAEANGFAAAYGDARWFEGKTVRMHLDGASWFLCLHL